MAAKASRSKVVRSFLLSLAFDCAGLELGTNSIPVL